MKHTGYRKCSEIPQKKVSTQFQKGSSFIEVLALHMGLRG